MDRKIMIISTLVLGFLIIFLILFTFGNLGFFNKPLNLGTAEICFEEKCWNVEVADSASERERGLMFYDFLDENSGMFFIFDSPNKYAFWMKDTLIPLDIIWLNTEFEVVYVANAVPCVTDECEIYDPNTNALYVLEINAGQAEEFGLSVGKKVDFRD